MTSLATLERIRRARAPPPVITVTPAMRRAASCAIAVGMVFEFVSGKIDFTRDDPLQGRLPLDEGVP
jgi:hypothetical protein